MSVPSPDGYKRGGKKGKGKNKRTSTESDSKDRRQEVETLNSDLTDDLGLCHGCSSGREEEKESSINFGFSTMQIVVTGILAAVYVATMQQTLPGGDAGELIVAADELGVAHPPGYPLFTLMLKAVFLLVPYGSVAWKANLLTSLLAALAGGFLYQAVALMTGSLAAGFLAAGMFSFSRLTWVWSVTAEVFALNNLLVAVLLVTAVCFSQCGAQGKTKVSQLGALVCGLCLSNQHTTIVYLAVLVPWVLYSLCTHKALSTVLLVKLSFWFSVGLLPYIYLPLSSMFGHARWTWGNQSTLSGFLTHLFRREYGTLHLLKDHEGQGLLTGLFAYMVHVAKDLTPAVLFFFTTTVFSVYKRCQEGCCEMMMVMSTMFFTYTVFFAWRANLDIVKPLYKGVVERFWMQSDLILVAMAAVAFSDVFRIMNRLVPLVKYHVDLLMAVMLVAMHVTMNVVVCDQSSNTVVEDFALSALKAFPPGAIVLTKGDLPSNSFRYFHLTESVRPDIVLFEQEVLTYDWSVPKLAHHTKGLVIPGDQMYLKSGTNEQGRSLFTFKQLLDANYDLKPIFGCIGVQGHEPSWEKTYVLRPFGVCMQFIRKGSALLKLDQWLNASQDFAANWSHPVPVEEFTWEEVASGEMWRAKTVAGLYLLEEVDSIKNKQKKGDLLERAYQIYRGAIEANLHFPGYWHKNFALVCEKLRHLTDDSKKKITLVRTTIAHFKAYLDSDTTDPQVPAIEDAIKRLQEYADSLSSEGR